MYPSNLASTDKQYQFGYQLLPVLLIFEFLYEMQYFKSKSMNSYHQFTPIISI